MPEETITNRGADVFVEVFAEVLEIGPEIEPEASVSKESDKIGLPPGTLIYVDSDGKTEEKLKEKSIIRLIQYNASSYDEIKITSAEELAAVNLNDKMTWIQVSGLWDVESVSKVGEIFHLDPLILEVVLDMEQRSKTHEYENYLFTILKQIRFDEKTRIIKDNQISIFTFEKAVLVFCEDDPQIFKSIVERIKKETKIRRLGSDYLTYTLIDMIVDHYFYAIEAFEGWMDDIEKRIIKNPQKEAAEEITSLRHQLSMLKKIVWPTITIAEEFEKCDSKLIKKQTHILFHHVL
jgi:magnesium transporter